MIGLDLLKPQPNAVSAKAGPSFPTVSGEVQFEIRHESSVKATAVEEDGEFVVLQGSAALTGTGSVQQSYGGLKEKLIADVVLVPHIGPKDADKLRFSKPWPFSSPFAAVADVLDRYCNGRLEWKVKCVSQS